MLIDHVVNDFRHAVLDRLIEQYPAGSRVVVTLADGTVRIGQTRGLPVVINGQAFMEIEGLGTVKACDVRPSYSAWVRFKRGRIKSRWIFGAWISREAMDLEIQNRIQRDPRVESFEVRNTKPVDLD